jgi:hypothetical protein
MNNETKDDKKEESYKCQICNKETKNSVDAITHYLDHGSAALNSVNAMIKDQRTGAVSPEDRSRIAATAAKVAAIAAEAASKVSLQNISKEAMVVQET